MPAAAAFSVPLLPQFSKVRLLQVAAMAPGFLARSVVRGLDIAWRAFRPSLPLRPVGGSRLRRRCPTGLSEAFIAALARRSRKTRPHFHAVCSRISCIALAVFSEIWIADTGLFFWPTTALILLSIILISNLLLFL